MTSRLHLLNSHNPAPHFSNGKTEAYGQEGKLEELGPSWTGSHTTALCPQLPLGLAMRDRAWAELDPTPQLLEGTAGDMGCSRGQWEGPRQLTNAWGHGGQGFSVSLGQGQGRQRSIVAVKGQPAPSSPWRAQAGRVRDSETWAACGLCDLNSCPPFSQPQPLLIINMARASVGSPVPGLCSNPFTVTPAPCRGQSHRAARWPCAIQT